MMRGRSERLPIPRLALLCLSLCFYLCLCFCVLGEEGSGGAFFPRTRQQHTLHVGRLSHSLDEVDKDVVLVSVTEERSVFLPLKHGSVDAAIPENLAFDGSFDPLWFYVFLNRGFENLEWAACSGQWRPEWSSPIPYEVNETDLFFEGKQNLTSSEDSGRHVPHEHTFDYLRYMLSHHDVCSTSSFSFCAHSGIESPAHQFKWVQQFMSTLLSSPLGWTDKTPRHIRPSGMIYERSSDSARFPTNVSGSENPRGSWCSYHLIYHDIVCSQHVNSLLNGGRRLDGVTDGLPEGIFRAVIPSLNDFFSSPFTHVHLRPKQWLRPGNTGEPGEVELRVHTQMSFVLSDVTLIKRMAEHWLSTLQPYAHQRDFRLYVGHGGMPLSLKSALPITRRKIRRLFPINKEAAKPIEVLPRFARRSLKEGGDALSLAKYLSRPEVQYNFRPMGKDHGYLVVALQPSLLLSACEISRQSSKTFLDQLDLVPMPFKKGDVLYTLVFFPLHLVRPLLYNLESLNGSTEVENYMVDVGTNTLTVLLKTNITSLHIEVYRSLFERVAERTRDCGNWVGEPLESMGVLLARFPFYNGWTGLKEMPRNANSYRVIPQPVVIIEREVERAETNDNTMECSVVCQHEDVFFEVTHMDALSGLLQVLRRPPQVSTYINTCAAGEGPTNSALSDASTCRCQYGVRAASASGVFIPEPDASMVFNAFILGLMFSSIVAVLLTRLTRQLTCPESNLEPQAQELGNGHINGNSNESDVFEKKNQ